MCELYDAVGFDRLERPQRRGIIHSKDRSVDADADGQREQRQRGKARIPAQRSQCIANVLEEAIEQRQSASLAMSFAELRDTAKMQPRSAQRFIRRKAAAPVVFCEQIEVRLQLLAEIAVQTRGSEERPDAVKKLAHRGHRFAICSRRPMVPATRSQSRASAASCLRPDVVML